MLLPSIFQELPGARSCIEKIANSFYPTPSKQKVLIMSKQPLCYMYLRDKVKGQEKKGFPGTLISYSIERPTAETHIVSYGLATFNTKDKKAIYSRRFLREIAVGRLHIEPKTITLPTKDYNSLRAIQHAIIVAMGEDKGLPTRAQKAIRHWMKETAKQEIKQATVKEEVLLLCIPSASRAISEKRT